MLRVRRFLTLTVFACTLGVAPSASATWDQFTTGSGSCSTIAAGDGTSPWCQALNPNSGTSNFELYWFDTHNNTWEDSGNAGQSESVSVAYDGTYNIPVWIATSGLTNNVKYAQPKCSGTLCSDIDGSTVPTFTAATLGTSPCAQWLAGAGKLSYGGSDDTVFSIGCTSSDLDFLSGLSGSWSAFSPTGGGDSVSASQDGDQLWIATGTFDVYCETDGFDGDGNHGAWEKVDGNLGSTILRIAAGGATTQQAWVIDTSHDLWAYNSPSGNYCYNSGAGSWTEIKNNTTANGNGLYGPNGIASSVSVGYNGTVWVVDTSGNIWNWN